MYTYFDKKHILLLYNILINYVNNHKLLTLF